MDEIGGFWIGACVHGAEVDLRVLARAAGGYGALRDGGEEALVALGVDPVRARAWARCSPRASRGAVLTLADPEYPAVLRTLAQPPPPFVCVEGDRACLDGYGVAVVGTRRCTGYGLGVARHLGQALASAGRVVVSGLARGVDAAAHKGALDAGRTVAVLGHGLGHTAPSTHWRLRAMILDHGGLLLSSWPDDDPPAPWRFPVRNKWIAGLSDHVIVVEAPSRSGALITAAEADAEGRVIWAVPGPLGAPASRGCLEILYAGAARMVIDVAELVAEVAPGPPVPPRADWLVHLFAGHPVEEVARAAGRSTAEVFQELAAMELRGEVVRLPGQRYAPARRPP